MPEVRQLNCPNCGAPLSVQDARRAKSAVCSTCGSQIDLTDPNLGILGQFNANLSPPKTPILPGMSGQFEEQFQVIGRIRYRDEEAWDEWLMITTEGRYRWLSEGREGFSIWDPFVPVNPIDLGTVGNYDQMVGQTLNLDGNAARVTDRGTGTVEFIEGEMSWKARAGDQMNYLEAEGGGWRYSVEWTPEEVEFFRGQRIEDNAVRRAFGLPERAAPPRRRRGGTSITLIVAIVVIVLVCLCIVVAASADTGASNGEGPGFFPIPIGVGGGSGGSSGGSSGGGSIRGGSPGGRGGGGSGSGGGGGK